MNAMRWIVVAVATAIAAVMVGCKVDQAKEVARYRSIVDAGTQPASFVPGKPITVEEAMALANQHNENIALSGENYVQALIAKDRAFGAFLPTISLAPGQSFGQDAPGVVGTAHHLDVPVSGQMTLFNGLRNINNWRAAAKIVDQRRALLLDAQASVLLSVAQTYYLVLRAERSVEVLKNSLAVQDERVRDMRARQKAGMARPLDLAQTEAQAAATRVSLVSAQHDVLNGRSVLAFLVGAPVQDSPLVDAARVPPEIPSLETLRDEAYQSRQDLIAARYAIEAAKAEVNAAIGEYYPSVSLNLNAYLYRETPPNDQLWLGLLQANLPIFSAGQIEADVRTAWSQFRQALLSESLTRRGIAQQVDISLQDVQASRKRITELQVQLTAAEEALRQSDQSYKVGLATNLERLTSQDALLSAQLQLTSERYNLKVFYLNLLRAMGQLSTRLPGEAATNPTTAPSTAPATQPVTTK